MTAACAHAIERALGYRFLRPEILLEATTHSTYANEHPGEGPGNQRLEFLGDAVLGLLVSRLVYEGVREGDEGEMSRRRARVIRRQGLAALARELALDEALRLGAGQRHDGGVTEGTLADAYEALAGAVFVDGGFAAVERCFGDRLAAAVTRASSANDFKTALQEACHARDLPAPCYAVAGVSGPDHARRFSCTVHVGDRLLGRGVGTSKKAAEQECAEAALTLLALEAP